MPKTQNDIPAFKTNKDLSWGQNLYAQLLHHAGGDDYAHAKIIPRIYKNDDALLKTHADTLESLMEQLDATDAGEIEMIELLNGKIDAEADSIKSILNRQDSALGALANNPFSTKVEVAGSAKPVNALMNTVRTAGGAVKTHPFAAGALGLAGAANIAGLVDNNKVGGQLIGGAAGAALPALFGASPMTTIALGATGGALGSLFDKLRAKKEAEQQSMYQQQEY